MHDEQAITIGRDAHGNAFVQGEGNVVIIQYHISAAVQPESEPSEAKRDAFGENPYKGLASFQEEDAERFFGREKLTRELWRQFRDLHVNVTGQPAPVRLLSLIGPSGSGKSSLARAGLVPELARHALPGLANVRVGVFTPGAHPLEALATMLARVATNDVAPVSKAREFSGELNFQNDTGVYTGLRRIASALPGISGSPLVLLIDQFEEAFSCTDQAEISAFVGNLMHAVSEEGAPVSAILALRSDFLGATIQYPELNAAVSAQSKLIPVMMPEELRQAIAKPAEDAKHPLDDAVIDLLIDQTRGQESALPLLQFTLQRIWEGLARGIPANKTIEGLGGVGGALATGAKEAFDRLRKEDRGIAKRAFLAMVNLGEGARDTRRRASMSELVAEGEDLAHTHEILQVFAERDRRLISLSAEEDEITMEITHEALLYHWDDLRNWLEQHREDIRFQRQLAVTVERWDKDNQPAGSLWRPPNLDRLRRFHDESELRLNETQSQFLHASEARQRRINRIRQTAVVGIGALLLVIAIGSAGFGIYADKLRQEAVASRKIAERESTVSKSRAILALAQSNRPNNVECSLLLAVKALQMLEGTKGVELSPYVNALRQSLANSYVLYTHRASETQVLSASWASDGRLIAYATLNGAVSVFDPTKPDTEHTLPITEASALAWHPSQSLLAVGKGDGHVEMWRLQDTKWSQERRVKLDDATVSAISWSPNAKFFVASSFGGGGSGTNSRTYLVNSQNFNATSIGFDGGIRAQSAWRPDSKVVAVIVRARSIALVDTAKQVQITLLEGHPANVLALSWHPRESWLAAGLDDGSIWIWDVNEKRRVSTLARHSNQVFGLEWSPDGRFLSSASWDGKIILWNAGRWTLFSVLSGHTSGILSLDWEWKGSRLVSASQDGTVRIWETRHPRSPITLHAADGWMWDAVWSPNGKYLASASDDATIKVWDRLSDTTTVLEGHRNQVTRLAWRYDSTKLASVSADGSLAVWDPQKATPIFRHRAHSGVIYGLTWSRSQDAIATSSSVDSTIRFWNSKTGAPILEIGGTYAPTVSFSPKDSVLAIPSAGTDFMALFDLDKREFRSTVLKGLNPSTATWGLAWSPSGDRIAAASDDNLVRIWNAETEQVAMVLKGHTSDVKGVVWNSDGTRLATASLDNTVRIWDAESGNVVAVLHGHSSGVRSVSWSNDGRTLASAGEDGTVRLSLVLDQDIIDLASRQINVGLTPPEQAACLVQINR